jgi:hypothetical protein
MRKLILAEPWRHSPRPWSHPRRLRSIITSRCSRSRSRVIEWATTRSASRTSFSIHRRDRVGRDRGKCRFKPHNRKVKCHATVHLNGEIGGFGNMRVRGDLDRGPDHLVVLGGTRQFDGVAGKVTIHNTRNRKIDRLHFDLVR